MGIKRSLWDISQTLIHFGQLTQYLILYVNIFNTAGQISLSNTPWYIFKKNTWLYSKNVSAQTVQLFVLIVNIYFFINAMLCFFHFSTTSNKTVLLYFKLCNFRILLVNEQNSSANSPSPKYAQTPQDYQHVIFASRRANATSISKTAFLNEPDSFLWYL